jgi:branched-chain amino acid transport system ATP-binding protein
MSGLAELVVRDLSVWYGASRALNGIDLNVRDGECVALFGANGSGKTSLLRAISCLVPSRGDIRLDGVPIRGRPERVARRGIGHVLEGRHVFTQLTVEENLQIARFAYSGDAFNELFDAVIAMFPDVKANRKRLGGQLSGGQQQMVAIARSLLADPKILLLDEPSLGLAPLVVDQLSDALEHLRGRWGTTLLLAEQSTSLALDVADRVYVLRRGRVAYTGPANDAAVAEIERAYLGLVSQ